MIFSTKRPPASSAQPKRRSMFSTLFVPHMGESLRPMGESFSVFVTLIAMIFAMNGLFPKDHPALKGTPGARLTLSEVLNTAWAGLSFTQRGLPKVLLFFAVAIGIVLAMLSIVSALALGLLSQAHAASPTPSGVFTPPNPTGDLASNWLTFLFDPVNSDQAITNINQTVQNSGVTGFQMPASTGLQGALISALAIYSNAILIIAAFILFYHLTAMVVETAHHGVPMGKRASQIWAPIRLVVAIGLLVPINSGLNCGQYIVLHIAQLGSALASNVWNSFATVMMANTTMPTINETPDFSKMASDLAMMYACEYSYNYQIAAVTASAGAGMTVGTDELINQWTWKAVAAPPAVTDTAAGKHPFTNQMAKDHDICGSYNIPSPPDLPSNQSALQPTATAIYNATLSAFSQANTDAAAAGGKIRNVMPVDPALLIVQESGPSLSPDALDLQVIDKKFQSNLKTAMAKIPQPNLSSLSSSTTASTEGWIAAGAWFNQLASAVATAQRIFQHSLPSTTPPDLTFLGEDAIRRDITGFHLTTHALNPWDSSQHNNDIAYHKMTGALAYYATQIQATAPTSASSASAPDTSGGCWTPMGLVLCIVEGIASHYDIWNSNGPATGNGFALGVQFSNASPLMDIAAFGQRNIDAATTLISAGLVITGIGTLASATGAIIGLNALTPAVALAAAGVIASTGGAIGGLLLFLGAVFFTIGIVMGFVIPLLPFMHFFFNTITWIATVAESIIAIPMVALAHLNPEGEGLPGQSARGAYYMIFSVFLRPVMMVFGLIAGLLIFIVGAGLLNALYVYAVGGASNPPSELWGSMLAVNRLMFTIIYVVMMYSIANHAFALIGRFPNQAMEWLGGKGLHGEKMGDPAHINQSIGVAGGYVSTKMAEQVTSMARGFQSAVEGGVAPIKNKQSSDLALGQEYGKAGAALPEGASKAMASGHKLGAPMYAASQGVSVGTTPPTSGGGTTESGGTGGTA